MNLPNLPLYQSMKKVRAGRISVIIGRGANTTCLMLDLPDGGETSVDVDAAWMDRHNPQVGGYFVVYPDSDNYTSYSPCDPFEEGHRLIPDLKPLDVATRNEYTRDLPDRRVSPDRRASGERRNVVIKADSLGDVDLEGVTTSIETDDNGKVTGLRMTGAKFPANPFPGVNIDRAHDVAEE